MATNWRQLFDSHRFSRDLEKTRDLAVGYVREETLDPLKRLGRFFVFGTIGALAVAVGSVFLLVGLLRILQTETSVFGGNLSWLPYVFVALAAVAGIALLFWRIGSGDARRRLSRSS